MNNPKKAHLKVFEMDKIARKSEVEFPGLWNTLAWEFLGRLKNNMVDKSTTWEDFDHIRILGTGGFGKVILSRFIRDDVFVAIKVMEKQNIVKAKQVHFAFNEKYIMSLCRFKFMLRLITAFQTNDNICYCLELAPGGDLFRLVSENAPFDFQTTRFYSGQIVLGLQYLHTMKIVYRDLKPENILISGNGYLKLADMGFAKLMLDNPRTYTFCGTPEYIAPEVILNKGYGTAVDWWAFGVMVYEFIISKTPFVNKDQMKIFKNITKCRYKLSGEIPDDGRNLIKLLLQLDPTRRVGNLRNGPLDVRYHPFYKYLNWSLLMEQRLPVPFPTSTPDYSKMAKQEKEINDLLDKSPGNRYSVEFLNF